MKKMFKSKNNLILTIVALVECILLLAITTYSWIESASSLRIATSNPVTIADSLNYEYVIDTSKAKAVDLSTYFSDTAFFSFAHASSADGKTLFLQRTVTNADGSKNYIYRQGDTTDYNTAYYNFDFLVNNSKNSESLLYFFNSQDVFTFDENSIVADEGQVITDNDKETFLNAFRVAITKGSGTPTIYSKSGNTCNASNTTTTKVPQTVKPFSAHLYDIDDSEEQKQTKQLFSSNDRNINIKIWFECNDVDFVALDDDVKTALLGATVNINLVFNNAESSFKTFRFNDYTNSIPADDTSGKAVYFYDGQKTYPMAKVALDVESDNETDIETGDGTGEGAGEGVVTTSLDYTQWATCDENGDILATVPDTVIKNMFNASTNDCYFFYGTVNASGAPVATYKWDAPSITTGYESFVFNALSVTPTSSTTSVGVGYWDDTAIKAVQFVDKTTYNSDNAYNAGGYQFVKDNRLYVGKSGDTVNTPINMRCVDTKAHLYKAYVPATYLQNQLAFYYTGNDYYASNVKVTWTAPVTADETPVYTAVGYNAKGKLTSSSFNAAGVGTWGETKRVNFSTELVDATALSAPDFRYRINFDSTIYTYMATDSSDPTIAYAYIPVEATLRQFNYLNSAGTLKAYWSINNNTDGSDTYYPIDIIEYTSSNPSHGMWNPVVLVDGTADNLIGYTT